MKPVELGLDAYSVCVSQRAFYVYLLYRGDVLVYVGKGCGARVGESVVEHRADYYEVVLITTFEECAYLVERSLIQLVGVANLDNYHGGGEIGGGFGSSGYSHSQETR